VWRPFEASYSQGRDAVRRQSRQSVGMVALGLAVLSYAVLILVLPALSYALHGQFFAKSFVEGTPVLGTDFWIYYLGPEAWFGHGVNPYDNSAMAQLVESGALATHHPNPSFDEMNKVNFAGNVAWKTYGYIATPMTLWLFSFVRWVPFVIALNAWALSSLIAFVMMTWFWTGTLAKATKGDRNIGERLLSVGLLVGLATAPLNSVIRGQIEMFYVVPMMAGLYLLTRKSQNKKNLIVGALLLAFAISVKLIPGIILLYYLYKAVRGWRQGDEQARTIVFWTVVGLTVLVGLTFILIPPRVIFFGLDKMTSLSSAPLRPTAEEKSSLKEYLSFSSLWWTMIAMSPRQNVLVIDRWFNPIRFILALLAFLAIRSSSRKNQLLEMSLLISLLPSVLPHWWGYYNVIMIVPMLITFYSAREPIETPHNGELSASPIRPSQAEKRAWIRWVVPVMLVAAFVCMNTTVPYVTNSLLGSFWNYDLARGQFSLPREAEGMVPRIKYLLVGYPGTLILFFAILVILVHKNDDRLFLRPGHVLRKFGRLRTASSADERRGAMLRVTAFSRSRRRSPHRRTARIP